MHVQNILINRMSDIEIQKLYDDFTSKGWRAAGTWELCRGQNFAKFIWDKPDQEPDYPPNHKPQGTSIELSERVQPL